MVRSSDILKAKILIVDDQEANVLVLERMLHAAGYAFVTSTKAPHEVQELHLRNRYDLILLDLQMPGMHGFQVMEKLKEIETDYLPVLVITAEPQHKLRALKAGARDFLSKPLDLAEVLMRVYNMLEVRLLNLETRRLYDQVLAQQKISERLLLNVLPGFIAERFKGHPDLMAEDFTQVVAETFPEATVVFADIVGFTKLSAGLSAQAMLALLNEIFSEFDHISDNRSLEKIKTIGDTYMAVAGIPVVTADHALRAAHAALDMLEAVEHINARNGSTIQMRIGIGSGPVRAGVVGKHKFIYDLWGQAVSSASLMQSHGVPGRVQVSESTWQRLGDPFVLEERGALDIKHKDVMRTWFLNGRSADAIKLAAA